MTDDDSADKGPADKDPAERKRLNRNWDELLQELRVVQTGVQILTGFLLTVPFSSRWNDLDDTQVGIYLAVLSGAVLTTGFVVAPVAFHRILFRQQRRPWLVRTANRSARMGLVLLALTSSGVLLLVFDIALGTLAGIIAFAATLMVLVLLWGVPPLGKMRKPRT